MFWFGLALGAALGAGVAWVLENRRQARRIANMAVERAKEVSERVRDR